MPNHIKAYIVILAIGFIYYLIWQNATRTLRITNNGSLAIFHISRQFFIAWALLTSAAFLPSNYLVYVIASIAIVAILQKKLPDIAQGGLYVVLLLAIPSLSKDLPGFFGLNRLVQISWAMILGLVFLFTNKSGKILVIRGGLDWIVFGFFLIVSLLSFRGTSITDGLRETFVYFNLIFVPYLIARRYVKGPAEIRFVFLGLTFITLILSGIAIFSSIKSWNLYQTLIDPLGLPRPTITAYKFRGGFLRASSTLGSIQMAAVGSVALIMFSYLTRGIKKSLSQKFALLIMVMGIIFTFSRAPWIIGIGMMVLYLALTYKSKGLLYFTFGVLVVGFLLFITGMLDSVMSGLTLKESGNVDYRQRLLEVGMSEIMKNPLFGDRYFRNSPDMQVLRQGEGIIDIVNTFLQIALSYGLIAVSLFAWALVVWPTILYRKIKGVKNEESLQIVRVYWVAMLGLAAMIFTVSSFNAGGNFFPLLMFLIGAGHGIKND